MAIINPTDNWSAEIPVDARFNLKPANTYKHQYQVVDNIVLEIKKIVVHKFRLGDVEDPDLYAGEPLYKWQNSEAGKWVMDHAVETPIWHRHVDVETYGYTYAITAKLSAKDLTFFLLKWGNDIDKFHK